jgi:hypothetical protein
MAPKPPLGLTDEQMSAVLNAAAPLPLPDRGPFLQALADALRGESELGDGSLHRALRSLQRQFFRPPVMVEVRHNSKVGEPIL